MTILTYGMMNSFETDEMKVNMFFSTCMSYSNADTVNESREFDNFSSTPLNALPNSIDTSQSSRKLRKTSEKR